MFSEIHYTLIYEIFLYEKEMFAIYKKSKIESV